MLHQPLVRYVAARFVGVGGSTIDDMVQVGQIGLIAALERFEPERERSFPTFAIPTIIGVIKHYLRDHTWSVKAPRRLRELGLSLRRIRAELEARLDRSPTIAEIADAAGEAEERIVEAMDLDQYYQPLSLEGSTPGGGLLGPLETIGDLDPALRQVELREALRRAFERLDNRQQAILRDRFFGEATQAQVAERLGMSQMHVSRLERQALQILKRLLS